METAIAKQEHKNMVDLTPTDAIRAKIESIRKNKNRNRLTQMKKEDENFCKSFIYFAWIFFEVAENELSLLSEQELEGLADLIYRRAKKRVVILWSILLVGWFLMVAVSERYPYTSNAFCALYKTLKNFYPNSFFPHKELKKQLRKSHV